jgi:hypothetical protein
VSRVETLRLGHRLRTGAVNVGYHHMRRFAGQAFTVGTANTMRPSGDNNQAILKSPHGFSSYLRPM